MDVYNHILTFTKLATCSASVENLSHLLSCPFEVQCMTILVRGINPSIPSLGHGSGHQVAREAHQCRPAGTAWRWRSRYWCRSTRHTCTLRAASGRSAAPSGCRTCPRRRWRHRWPADDRRGTTCTWRASARPTRPVRRMSPDEETQQRRLAASTRTWSALRTGTH